MTRRDNDISPLHAPWEDPGAGPDGMEEGFATMANQEYRHLMSEEEMERTLAKMAKAIVADIGASNEVALVGIRTRGVPLADWLAKKIEKERGQPILIGALDINLYRDDLSEVDVQPVVRQTELPFPIGGKGIILVDDVLFTGRTIRAAMDELIDFGRPTFVRLAVMIDRVGFRELPIQADYIGRAVDTTPTENVKVMLKEIDGKNEIIIKNQT